MFWPRYLKCFLVQRVNICRKHWINTGLKWRCSGPPKYQLFSTVVIRCALYLLFCRGRGFDPVNLRPFSFIIHFFRVRSLCAVGLRGERIPHSVGLSAIVQRGPQGSPRTIILLMYNLFPLQSGNKNEKLVSDVCGQTRGGGLGRTRYSPQRGIRISTRLAS